MGFWNKKKAPLSKSEFQEKISELKEMTKVVNELKDPAPSGIDSFKEHMQAMAAFNSTMREFNDQQQQAMFDYYESKAGEEGGSTEDNMMHEFLKMMMQQKNAQPGASQTGFTAPNNPHAPVLQRPPIAPTPTNGENTPAQPAEETLELNPVAKNIIDQHILSKVPQNVKEAFKNMDENQQQKIMEYLTEGLKK